MDVRTIVVGVDGSACSDAAIDWAAAEAARCGARLDLLHTSTYTELVGAPTLGAPLLRQDVDAPLLQAALDRAGVTAPGVDASARTVQSDPASALIAAGDPGSLIVVGCHGKGWLARVLLGSVSHRVAAHARTVVVVVHAAHDGEPAQPDAALPVVVGVDGSPGSTAAVRWAATYAAERGVALVVVHGWLPAPVSGFDSLPVPQDVVDSQESVARTVLMDSVDLARSTSPGIEVRHVMAPGSPVPAIAHEAAHASMVVVGAHGHGGLSGTMLGSVTSGVIDGVRCPVVVAAPVQDGDG